MSGDCAFRISKYYEGTPLFSKQLLNRWSIDREVGALLRPCILSHHMRRRTLELSGQPQRPSEARAQGLVRSNELLAVRSVTEVDIFNILSFTYEFNLVGFARNNNLLARIEF